MCVDSRFMIWYQGMVQGEVILLETKKFPRFLLVPFPVVFCLQAGKKPVRAVLWVSADGLRVVDDKTKVISPFSPPSQARKHLDQKEVAARGSARGFSSFTGGSCC